MNPSHKGSREWHIHYPLAFAAELNWAIAPLVFLLGVSIRHYFNTYHATKKKLYWTWVAVITCIQRTTNSNHSVNIIAII